MISEQTNKNRDIINILILLTAALCIGIYLIATTAVIAKDGVTFIEYAKKLEAAPVETMISEYQHPGYPWLIFTVHKMTEFWHKNTSVFSWIYCAQGITLLSRLITIIIMYFIGKKLLGRRWSFWAVLILIILPKPAQYGSDVLSDWPHLCFMTAGLLLMLSVSCDKKFWLFGFAGLVSGLGYLIRPECVQVVVLGGLWLGLQLILPERIISRSKALLAMFLLVIGFLVASGPYMKLKGTIFPKKSFDVFTQQFQQVEISEKPAQVMYASQFAGLDAARAFGHLGNNIGEMLVWYFVPGMFIGMYVWLKAKRWYEPEPFFAISFAVLNVMLIIWLHCKYNYMSYRHTLPLLLVLIFFVPVGMQKFAGWFQYGFSKYAKSLSLLYIGERQWFWALFLIGFSIGAHKLFRPIRIEKQGYRVAANWLADNTRQGDLIAVPDIRIAFYAQRQGLVYDNGSIPEKAGYVVKTFQKQEDKQVLVNPLGKLEYEYVDKTKRGTYVTIYRSR